MTVRFHKEFKLCYFIILGFFRTSFETFLGMKTERLGFKTLPTHLPCDLELCQSLRLPSVRLGPYIVMDGMFVCPPHSCVEALTTNVMLSGGWPLGSDWNELRQSGGSPLIGLVFLQKEGETRTCPLYMRDTGRKQPPVSQEEGSHQNPTMLAP